MSTLRIHLIRHGQSEQNAKPDMMGQEPFEPLSALGREQGRKLKEYLSKKKIKFDHIFSSPYTRAADTCSIVCEGMDTEIKYAVALREYSAGEMVGKVRSVVVTPEVAHKMTSLGMNYCWPGGESLYNVEQRAMNWLYDNILERRLTGDIAIFSHGMTIKCILHKIMGFDPGFTWRLGIENTSISTIEMKDGQWFVRRINSLPHLDGFEN